MDAKSAFDPGSPCLVVAPHLEYPVRTGADLLIEKKYGRFSEKVPFVDLIGKHAVVRYQDGRPVRRVPFENAEVSKAGAALGTLRRRSHYLLEKFLTREYREVARAHLANPEYKTAVFSHVWAADVARGIPKVEGRVHCIETHNDEILWYENLRKSSANPLAKLTAYSSERWASSFLRRYGSGFLLLHVSEADRRGFAERFPDLKGCVVPIGVELPDGGRRLEDPAASDKVRLIFVGSLGVKINTDALSFFSEIFYPKLKKYFGERLEVLIVGSNPSKRTRRLCEAAGWELRANVSDEELEHLYAISLFSILPFSYTTGSKLKLLGSLSHGVPYLATESLREQVEEVAYPCLISDDPEAWSGRVRDVMSEGIPDAARTALRHHARQYSWEAVARRTFELLERGGRY